MVCFAHARACVLTFEDAAVCSDGAEVAVTGNLQQQDQDVFDTFIPQGWSCLSKVEHLFASSLHM